MLKNQESCVFFMMSEFAMTLALQRTYRLGAGGIFSSVPGFETLCRSFYLEFQIVFMKLLKGPLHHDDSTFWQFSL